MRNKHHWKFAPPLAVAGPIRIAGSGRPRAKCMALFRSICRRHHGADLRTAACRGHRLSGGHTGRRAGLRRCKSEGIRKLGMEWVCESNGVADIRCLHAVNGLRKERSRTTDRALHGGTLIVRDKGWLRCAPVRHRQLAHLAGADACLPTQISTRSGMRLLDPPVRSHE